MKKTIYLLLWVLLLSGCRPHEDAFEAVFKEQEHTPLTADEIEANESSKYEPKGESDKDQPSEPQQVVEDTSEDQENKTSAEPQQDGSELNSAQGDNLQAGNEIVDPQVEWLLSHMSLEEKIAQLFIVDIYLFNNKSDTTRMTEGLRERFLTYPVGGVIFFGSNIEGREQVTTFIKDIQETAETGLFISVDEEGGIVRRLGNKAVMGMTEIPTASVIGSLMDEDYAQEVGQTLGSELKALGFNMNFAPVSDVNTNPLNPIIGDRAYGDNPEIVSRMIVPIIKGLQENGVAAVAKHFPGHGDTETDSHTGDVIIDHDMERLSQIELVPFQAAIESEVMAIMSAHIIMRQITETELPATLSPEIMTGLLREEMGFKGLIITDALTMDAVSERYETGELCVMAILAGVDLLLMPEDFEEGFQGLLNAVEAGILSMERIDESVRRILSAKSRLGLLKEN